MTLIFFISLFERAFKVTKNGISVFGDSTLGCWDIQGFGLLEDLIVASMWPQNDVKSQKMQYL